MVNLPKQKVTLNLPSEVVRAYRLAAIRQGVADQALVETALREYLGLSALKELQAAFAHLELSADEADQLAVSSVRATRRDRARGVEDSNDSRAAL
jgi:hypothetical protein